MLRERFEMGMIDLDPFDLDLHAQLVSIKWQPNSRGQIVVESKEDMAKRGLPSPDHADAVMMAGRPSIIVPDAPEGIEDYTSDLLGRPM
jgi:hypothetical protein